MTDRLVTFLLGRAVRERWLIGILCAAVLPLAVVMFWVLPLLEQRQAARGELAAAQDLRLWVAARAQEKAALDAANPALGCAAPLPDCRGIARACDPTGQSGRRRDRTRV